jgi:hypothetical protein
VTGVALRWKADTCLSVPHETHLTSRRQVRTGH